MPVSQKIILLAIAFTIVIAHAEEYHGKGRIIDGTLVPTTQFPTVGKIGSTDTGDICTGTLIAPRFVLTAAHCVNEQRPGSIDFAQNAGTFVLSRTTYRTKHVYVHPSYAGDQSQQKEGAIDLAIYELEKPITKVMPTPLYRKTPQVNLLLTLAGFGYLGTGFSGAVNRLPPQNKISVGHTPIDIVTNTFIKWNFDNVPSPNQESNTAPGDSGGPQFITEYGVMYLASVTSGGVKASAQFGDLSYNTRVDIAADWIDSITGGTPVPGNKPPVITSFTASAIGFTNGTPLTFSVTATDSENDPLQYHWLFGDGTEDINGTPTEMHTFDQDGTFLVQVVVTDRNGGSVGKAMTVATIASDPPTSQMTQAMFLKKSFLLDYSEKNKPAKLDITFQHPSLKFPDERTFLLTYKPNVIATIFIGSSSVDSIFGTSVRDRQRMLKLTTKKAPSATRPSPIRASFHRSIFTVPSTPQSAP